MIQRAAPQAKYHADQRVEVEVYDFGTRGYPLTWMPGTVTEVLWCVESGLFDVRVRMDHGGFGHQLVGRRGGNNKIRPARGVA